MANKEGVRMQHLKLYHSDTLDHNGQTIYVEGPYPRINYVHFKCTSN